MTIAKMIVAFFLDQWKLSMALAIKFSKTAITVEKDAKVIKTKNNVPHKRPNGMLIKTLGPLIRSNAKGKTSWENNQSADNSDKSIK